MTFRPARPVRFAAEVGDVNGQPALVLRGELDLWTQPQLAAALASFAEHYAPITLDLAGVDFIDAGSIGLIYQTQALARLRGTELVLRSPNPRLSRILEMTGLVTPSSNGDRPRPIVLPLSWRAYEGSSISLEASS